MTQPRAIIYTRISQDRSGDGAGIDRQLVDCRAKAQANGWTVVAELSDNDVSAYSGRPRPAYLELLKLLEAAQADAVIAWHEDRLHRSPIELEHYMAVCQPRNIETDFVQSGRLDLRTASGRMVARIRGAVAREEVEHKSEREQSKRLKIAQAGGRHKAARVYGWEPDGMNVRESEAAIVREITERLIAGETCSRVANALNARSVPTIGGAKWTGIGVKKTALRASNAALRTHKGIEYPGNWQPIITVEQYREVQLVMSLPNNRYKRTAGRKYLLTGLAYCGACGSKLGAHQKASNGRPAYRCEVALAALPGRKGCGKVVRQIVPLERLVSEAALYRLSGDGLAKLLHLSEETDAEVKELLQEAEAQRRRIQRIVDEYATTDVWTAAEFSRAKATASQRIKELERQITEKSAHKAVGHMQIEDDIASWWETATVDDRRQVVELLVERVVVKPQVHKGFKVVKYGDYRFDPALVDIIWRV